MNIYKVKRTDSVDYDEYDSFVCVAASEEEARNMNPFTGKQLTKDERTWVPLNDTSELQVDLVGIALPEFLTCVICSSFNAG